MGGSVQNAALFLVDTLFELYLLIMMLRFLLQLFRADFHNTISQFIATLTNPLVLPLQRLMPNYKTVNFAVLFLLVILVWLKWSIIIFLQSGGFDVLIVSPLLIVGSLLNKITSIFFFAIIIRVILSWVNPSAHHPAVSVLYSLTEPLLGPARQMIPAIGGLDLSPLVVIIMLKLVDILLVYPLLGM